MKVRAKLTIELGSDRLAQSASRSLEVDNKSAPQGLMVACTCRGRELIVDVEHEEPLTVLSTLEDILTCLTPLVKLENLTEPKESYR